MAESKLTYEEWRRQRLEENKKRMEELKLHLLAESLKTPSPKPSPVQKRVSKPQAPSVPVRRSSRLANKPAPNYEEGLPVHFCKKHLPHFDETITLVDEEEYEFPTKYLAEKTILSGGWRGFSIDHELVDGDAFVFQLVKLTTFKLCARTEIYASSIT